MVDDDSPSSGAQWKSVDDLLVELGNKYAGRDLVAKIEHGSCHGPGSWNSNPTGANPVRSLPRLIKFGGATILKLALPKGVIERELVLAGQILSDNTIRSFRPFREYGLWLQYHCSSQAWREEFKKAVDVCEKAFLRLEYAC